MKQYQENVFGKWQNQEVRAYRLENDKGYQLSVMTYGATILEYVTPDKEDQFTNIILGFDPFLPDKQSRAHLLQSNHRLPRS